MAIIRITASAGAVLLAVMAVSPTVSLAQAPKAPLQLVPGPDQARPTMRPSATKPAKPASNKSAAHKSAANKAAQTSLSRTNARQAVAARQAAPKTARTNAKQPTGNTVASQRPNHHRPNAQRARVADAHRAPHAVAATPRSAVRQEAPALRLLAARIFAQGGDPAVDNVMRDGDSISLIARLPWWRNDRMQDVQYGSVEAEDAVMEAAAVWLAVNGGDPEAAADRAPGQRLTLTSPEETIEVADAGVLNEIDLTAGHGLPPPTPTFLQSLMALIGGIAAAAAATARALFA